MSATLTWYVRRLARMAPGEVAGRLDDRLRQELWTLRWRRGLGTTTPCPTGHPRRLGGPLVGGALADLPSERRADLLAAAEELLNGRWNVLGYTRTDLGHPEWFFDPVSGRRYPEARCAFRIDYRNPDDTRWVKQVWELSRHHQLTLLGVAWQLTGDEAYAEFAARHLRSWWAHNPPLTGINWTSGIEIGIRLISWVWVRRLLQGWGGAAELFENNDEAVRQIYWHQRYLATFTSAGSSANNHLVAEAAGQVVGTCAFDWFDESARWRDQAIARLQDALRRNVFASGVNREQAFEYHGLVAELGLIAAAEAAAAAQPVSDETCRLLCRMVDVVAAVVDVRGRPPRYGDGDEGRALLLDAPQDDRWASLLALGAAFFGRLSWWPDTSDDARSLLVRAVAGHPFDAGRRPDRRPTEFADAGMTILRAHAPQGGEIWCRCDGGPHGFLSIAAHAHADALSVEIRHEGIDILCDPGTYCYQGDPSWRTYFRSSAAHNTLEIDGHDQSEAGGPFLWTRHAATQVLEVAADGDGPLRWSARHDGYGVLASPVWHRRTVTLHPVSGSLEIVDAVETEGRHQVQLAFHLGPTVEASLTGNRAELQWRCAAGTAHAVLRLPMELEWSAHRGETDPILGWYSPGFGRKEAITSLVGRAVLGPARLRTELSFSGPPSHRVPAQALDQVSADQASATNGGMRTDMATARSNRYTEG